MSFHPIPVGQRPAPKRIHSGRSHLRSNSRTPLAWPIAKQPKKTLGFNAPLPHASFDDERHWKIQTKSSETRRARNAFQSFAQVTAVSIPPLSSQEHCVTKRVHWLSKKKIESAGGNFGKICLHKASPPTILFGQINACIGNYQDVSKESMVRVVVFQLSPIGARVRQGLLSPRLLTAVLQWAMCDRNRKMETAHVEIIFQDGLRVTVCEHCLWGAAAHGRGAFWNVRSTRFIFFLRSFLLQSLFVAVLYMMRSWFENLVPPMFGNGLEVGFVL